MPIKNNISEYTPATIRSAVITIRNSKLPNPSEIANNGSFFANPIIPTEHYNQLKESHPDIPGWEHDGKIKIPAAWLIEHTGLKDYKDTKTGMATWRHQPLVLVNETASSTDDLLAFRDTIIQSVKERFGIELHQEPELL